MISGKPEIECGLDSIFFKVDTMKGTPSSIYVKGNMENSECRFHNVENVSIPLHKCNMRKKREVNPNGVAYSFIVVVQLHPVSHWFQISKFASIFWFFSFSLPKSIEPTMLIAFTWKLRNNIASKLESPILRPPWWPRLHNCPNAHTPFIEIPPMDRWLSLHMWVKCFFMSGNAPPPFTRCSSTPVKPPMEQENTKWL